MDLILPSGNTFLKAPDLAKELGLLKDAPIVSIAGAGGKTSLLEAMAGACLENNQKAIATTTTHMFYPDKRWTFTDTENPHEITRLVEIHRVLWIGTLCCNKNVDGRHKIAGAGEKIMEYITSLSVPVLIEADGARGLPFKVPGPNEPVIPKASRRVIGVLGLDALGEPIEKICFRREAAARLLCKAETDILTADDYVKVIESREGLRKHVGEHMQYTIFLNKADTRERIRAAFYIRSQLLKKGIRNVYISSFKDSI